MHNHQYQQPPDFHLVIPCYEESSRLPSYLCDLILLLREKEYSTNILIVDDGSNRQERARLKEIISELGKTSDLIMDPLYLEKNMGKGYAVRAGWQTGRSAKWLAFVDADGATPACEVIRIFDTVYQNNDSNRCYMGSRIRMLGRSVERHWKRHVVGRMYATLVGIVINEAIYDSQCGFKIIPGQAFAAISNVLSENRFAFDSELIAALSDAGYCLEETPVDWKDIPGSKVSIIKDSTRMVKSLFLIQTRRKNWTFSNKGN
jgi:glycosyltransferase involved in cell wall biosynthesis